MLILHLTDFHVTEAGTLLGAIDTRAAFSRLMKGVANLAPKPDLIIVSGDLGEQGSDDEYAFVAAGLRSLKLPFVVVPGNHDRREPFRRAFPGETGSEPDHLAFMKDFGDVRVIGLDTLVEGAAHGELGAPQLDWLEEHLAQLDDRPALIVMHHPPFATHLPAMDAIGLSLGRERLLALLSAQPAILGILCGHVHRAIRGRFGRIDAVIAPSASHQFALDFLGTGRFDTVCEPAQIMLHRVEAFELTGYLLGLQGTP